MFDATLKCLTSSPVHRKMTRNLDNIANGAWGGGGDGGVRDGCSRVVDAVPEVYVLPRVDYIYAE